MGKGESKAGRKIPCFFFFVDSLGEAAKGLRTMSDTFAALFEAHQAETAKKSESNLQKSLRVGQVLEAIVVQN